MRRSRWNQSSAINHEISLGYETRIDDTQWLDSPTGGPHPVGVGIGGVSYVFGDINQKTADVTLRSNILFSRNQSLEIYANDVRCTHGATIGRLDEAALFYLRSRGIPARQARDLLVHAFADDVLGKIPHEGARTAVGRALFARLARDLEG